MAPEALEREAMSLVGHHDVDGRPGFKIALQEIDGQWYCYLAGFWHSGWAVLDVTDPADPELLNWIDGPENTFTLQVQVADGLMVTSLEKPREREPTDGPSFDPAADYEEGAIVWDVETDPAAPEPVGRYHTGGEGTHRNYYAGGDYAYMAAVPDDCEGRMLEVVDLSDPSDPETVGRWWWPGQHEDDDEAADETYYLHGPAYVHGDRAYLSYGRVGMVMLNVSDPTDPTLLSRLGFGGLGSWLGAHSAIPLPDTELAVINSEAILESHPLEGEGDPLNYAFVVDVSDGGAVGFDGQRPTGPRIVSSLPLPTPEDALPYETYYGKPGRFGPHNQHHSRTGHPRHVTDDHLFMTWFNAGLRVFDISEALAPTEVGYFVPTEPDERKGGSRPATGLVSTLEDVVVDSRGYVYCTDPHQGLLVFETDLL